MVLLDQLLRKSSNFSRVVFSNSSILVVVVVAWPRPVSGICVDFDTKRNESQRELNPWRCRSNTKYPYN